MTTSSVPRNHVMFVTYRLPSLPSAYAIGCMVSLSWLHLLFPEITSWFCLHDTVYHLCLLLTQSAVWLAPNYYFFSLSRRLSMFSVLGVFSGFPSCLVWVLCFCFFRGSCLVSIYNILFVTIFFSGNLLDFLRRALVLERLKLSETRLVFYLRWSSVQT